MEPQGAVELFKPSQWISGFSRLILLVAGTLVFASLFIWI
jgi:hypothetical protein